MTSNRTTSGGIVPVVMESKIPRETHRFTWNIADFAEVRNSVELVEALSVTFDMGQSIGLPVTFKAYLQVANINHDKWIGWYVDLVEAPDNVFNVMGNPLVKVANLGGKKSGNALKYPLKRAGWGFADFIRKNEDVSKLPLDANGSLPMQIEMTLYNTGGTGVTVLGTINGVMAKFQGEFLWKLSDDMEMLYKEPTALITSETPAIIAVISKDGRKIGANSGILAARSPVFRTMFQTPMKEVKEGVVKMEDIGGEALEVFLHFLHTATLKDKWKEPGVLEELTCAAHKYLMQDLLEFLDEAIGLVCTPANCLNMIRVAHQLELMKATEALLKMYQEQWKQATGLEEMIQLLHLQQ